LELVTDKLVLDPAQMAAGVAVGVIAGGVIIEAVIAVLGEEQPLLNFQL
jgi:hypothetical protein